ncbi:MAG: mechanosensitive ion channel domain-containing protein [Candidatus Woesearchaeota archaeon]
MMEISIYDALKYLSVSFGLAFLIFLMGLILSNFLSTLAYKFVKKIKIPIKKLIKLKKEPEIYAKNIVKYIIISIFTIMSLLQIGIAVSLMNFLLYIFAGILIISFGLSLRDFFPNAIAGIYVIYKKLLKTGDKIEIDNISGKIFEINLINTHLIMSTGNVLIIPNSYLIKNIIIKGE